MIKVDIKKLIRAGVIRMVTPKDDRASLREEWRIKKRSARANAPQHYRELNKKHQQAWRDRKKGKS